MLTHAIETFGIGAKGFYMFDGVIKDISFNSIITHGDASSAYDSSCFVERISVSQGITTFGSVRKVRVGEKWLDITANGVYLRKGATIKELKISGDISTHGISAKAIYNEGAIEKLLVGGMVFSDGDKGIAMEIKDGFLGGENIKFVSNHSEALILFNAKINGCKNLIAKGKEYDILSNENTTVNRVRIKDAEIENVFQKGVRINFILDEPDNADESPDKEINIQISDDKNADKTVTEENKKSTIIKMEDITPKLTEGHGGGPMTCKAPDDIKPKDKP